LGDIIRFEDKFYVLASSSLADNRTRILKFGETFGVFNRYGDIETVGRGQLGACPRSSIMRSARGIRTILFLPVRRG
jgi:hypothetical protein